MTVSPSGENRVVPPTLRFAEDARRLGAAARAAGLEVPAFRAPPSVPGVTRTVRRYPGGCVVSVVLKDRDHEAVVVDMVEGILALNECAGDADLRQRLLDATTR